MQEGIVGAVTGALAGGLVSFFLTKWKLQLNSVSNLKESIALLVEDLCIDSANYWRTRGDAVGVEELGIKISGNTNRLVMRTHKLLPFLKRSQRNGVSATKRALYDALTDGDFGTKNRGPDLQRAERIKVLCRDFQSAVG